MTATAPGGVPLVGSVVRLDPLVPADAADLLAALDDERVWAAGYGGGPAARFRTVDAARAWIDAASGRAAYAVRLLDGGRLVGTSSLGDVDLTNERVHLGWTAYAPDAWGTAVNPECKLLLLGHAFDSGFGRVKIQTDAINARSQAAIAKLGATREGTLRRHTRRADGTFRDTVVFSVLADEWPAVRAGLQDRLSARRPGWDLEVVPGRKHVDQRQRGPQAAVPARRRGERRRRCRRDRLEGGLCVPRARSRVPLARRDQYLLSNPVNAEWLRESIEQARQGRAEPHEPAGPGGVADRRVRSARLLRVSCTPNGWRDYCSLGRRAEDAAAHPPSDR
ncbi:hypothetical protein GCM10025868_26080 [Angustibacter aerolatus]|uniref:N-acetyltransferase domain-containing protein n=1 Tax=Angustibacter aerolatus TaxID=1162965 RepID=A0ABQ6JGP3_9ACTN|nr:hypothetical protein GCM10025868_26080 [Angustibacter aerolatus]